jgi:hypothetical protein
LGSRADVVNEAVRPFVFLCTLSVFDVLLCVTLGCLSMLGWAVWERRASAARAVLAEAPSRSVLLGLLDLLGGFVLCIVLVRLLPVLGRLLALVVLFLLGALLLVGLPAVTLFIGERILALAERAGNRIVASWVGAATLSGSLLLPWVGWTVFILCVVAGVGSAAMAGLRKPMSPPS